MNQTITEVRGVRVGNSVSRPNRTGCTVILFDTPAVTAVDARGGWPGTFDTDSIGFGKTFFHKNALFLTGGDVFGLNCAQGIQKFLLQRKLASSTEPGYLPGIVGANIYDIDFGKDISTVDYVRLGHAACLDASTKAVQQGNFGAGIGATVGKLRGMKYAMKGGLGSSSVQIYSAITIGALVVVNAVGNVVDTSARTVAGARMGNSPKAGFFEFEDLAKDFGIKSNSKDSLRATTIGAVVTNLSLTHEECYKVAEMAHDGLARSIRPSHTTTDGDTLFCVSTGEKKVEVTHNLLDVVGHLASIEISKSVVSAVRHAKPLNNLPACESS